MARTRLLIESKYFPFLTTEERDYIGKRIGDKFFYQYKNKDICTVGILAEILKGRTADEFVADLESRMDAFNKKYSCNKELSVRVDSDRLFIKLAYNEQLKNELKKELSAKWHADSKEWSVPLADEVAANDIVKKHLGKGFLKVEPEAEVAETEAVPKKEVAETEAVEDMEDYKKETTVLGASEIAALVLVGMRDGKLCTEILNFGTDGRYTAYIVRNKNTSIPSHYDLISMWDTWLRIYDDEQLMFHHHKYKCKIEIYRAGEFGTIIRILE